MAGQTVGSTLPGALLGVTDSPPKAKVTASSASTIEDDHAQRLASASA